MHRIILFATLLSLVLPLRAQQIKKTYYDYAKTRIDEEYQANSAGYVHGYYKKYDRNGALVEQGYAQNGKLQGEYKKWTTYTGARELASIVTYKNGMLEGPAKYYGPNGILLRSGHFVNDEKEGVWEELYSAGSNLGDCGYFKGQNIYKNGSIETRSSIQSAHLTVSENKPSIGIVSGDKTDGAHRDYYHPCKKLYSEYMVLNGKVDGIHKMFDTQGHLWKEITYHYSDGKETVLTYKSFYPNGQIEYLWDGSKTSVVFEEYDENGEVSGLAKQLKEEETKQKAFMEMVGMYQKADSLFLSKKYDEAETMYKAANQKRGATYTYQTETRNKLREAFALEDKGDLQGAYALYGWLKYNMGGYGDVKFLIDSAASKTIREMNRYFTQSQLLKNQSERINHKIEVFVNSYLVKTPTGATYNNEPIYSNSYPKGKALFEKSRLVIGPQLQRYNEGLVDLIKNSSNESFDAIGQSQVKLPPIQDLISRFALGEILEANLDRMINLSTANTDDYKKTLKKAKDEQEIKTIIGLR